MIQATINGA